MTPLEMAEKYDTILRERASAHVIEQMESMSVRRGLPVNKDNPNVVHFNTIPTLETIMDNNRKSIEKIASALTIEMLKELSSLKVSYDFTIETICRAMQMQNSTAGKMPLAEFMEIFKGDYPIEEWERDNRTFSES